MLRSVFTAAAAAALVVAAGVAAAKGEEPVQSVKLAKTWEGAVEEAKTLNLPIVVHHHGFYCPPCWGMHQGVMCNEDYIKFAAENTVEVIALQDLEKGIEKGERNAAEYEAKDEKGTKTKYMVEFPGLTRDEVLALHNSKASSYNDTGGIPFTCIVDPHTLAEMQRFAGGGHSAKKVMEGVAAQRKVLNEKYGPSLSRAKLEKVRGDAEKIAATLPKGGVAKAMAEYRKAEKSVAAEPDAMKKQLEPVLKSILGQAVKELDAAEGLIGSDDPAAAKKLLDKLGNALAGTELEARCNELKSKVKV